MRTASALTCVLLLITVASADGQTIELHGAAGRAMHDGGGGYSVSAGLGIAPISRLTVTIDAERTHRPSRVRLDQYGYETGPSARTVNLITGAVRATLLRGDRVGPYGLAGITAGVLFRENLRTWQVRGPMFGGGIQVPLGERVLVFGEARMILLLGNEADQIDGVAPIRGGIAWRF